MGIGKTNELMHVLTTLPASATVVLVSFRRSFTQVLSGLGFTDYRDCQGPISLGKTRRVIVQLGSLPTMMKAQ